MTITFPVSPVDRCRDPLVVRADGKSPMLLGRPVEAWGGNCAATMPTAGNPLVRAVHLAFDRHYPLVLSPDILWLAIAHGFAVHVTANAERLRGRFVPHQGRARIQVRRDDFVKGCTSNPWPEVFSLFSTAIAAQIGRQRDLVVGDFSTTGPCERAAYEVVLMATVQCYFKLEFMTLCGIPEIRLEGTVDDWCSIRQRVLALGAYELSWWVDALLPVVDQFIAAARGEVDTAFWRSIYKLHDESGGPYANGWINTLFPYLEGFPEGTFEVNAATTRWATGMGGRRHGAAVSAIPVGMRTAPFDWLHLGRRYPMEFLGGFVGLSQDPETLAIRPAIGWAVRDAAG